MDAPLAAETPHRLIEIAVDGVNHGSDHGVLTYAIPDGWESLLAPGSLVWVPVRQRIELGIVSGVPVEAPDFEIKELYAPVEPAISLAPWQLDTARWMARETASSLFGAASLFLSPGIEHRQTEILHADPDADLARIALTKSQSELMILLRERGPLSLDAARTATGKKLDSVIAKLVDLKLIRKELRVDQHTPGQPTTQLIRLLSDDLDLTARAVKQRAVQEALISRRRLLRDGDSEWTTVEALRDRVAADSTLLNALVKKEIVELRVVPRSQAPQPRSAPPPVLTAQQAAAWSSVERSLAVGDSQPILLFGVTGSGKTEIYLRGVAWCLRAGKSAIILLPEIALATQVVRRFIDRFPGKVAVLHSQMSPGQRHATWQAIEDGEFPVVVGPRSALFAPVQNLGMIVLDEEHENTYKQDSDPRYHARNVAEYIARQHGATVILGSATPAIESWYRSEQGTYRRLELTERVSPNASHMPLELPPVEIVDLRQELHQSNTSLLSRRLQELMVAAHGRGEQSILLLNRRGQSTVVLCRACGHRLVCPHCDIPLVFHRDSSLLICHRCDYRERPPRNCPDCHGHLDFFGAGTQRVEDEVHRLFPQVRLLRWDQDSVRQQGGYESMLERVEAGLVDVVVGTQMVAKGFDLPKVTVVGVIQADSTLHLPDFRSPERTFQLVTQVAGRAGRRSPGSRVIVQTYTPEHYAIQTASRHDYLAFYEEESAFRQHFVYPPFARLIRCVYKHKQERAAAVEAEMMARALAKHAKRLEAEIDLLGPTPAFAAKVRGMYQWQVIVRGHDLEAFLIDLPVRPGWVIDVDPQSML
jgi:primosomal protein N' (replication factor Y)